MVVKGYYASICHGLTFLGALANLIVGLGISGVGAFIALDFLLGPYGLALPGWIMSGAGLLIFFNGVTGMTGGCKESRGMIKTTMYLSIIQILTMIVVIIFLMTSAMKEDKLRLKWSSIPEEKRTIIETKLQCCGYDETDEGVAGCKFKKACGEFVPTNYKKRFATATAACAAGFIAGALSLFASFCLQRKMTKQAGRAKKKEFTSLQDEARGINKNTRPKRPPRSERTPHHGGSSSNV